MRKLKHIAVIQITTQQLIMSTPYERLKCKDPTTSISHQKSRSFTSSQRQHHVTNLLGKTSVDKFFNRVIPLRELSTVLLVLFQELLELLFSKELCYSSSSLALLQGIKEHGLTNDSRLVILPESDKFTAVQELRVLSGILRSLSKSTVGDILNVFTDTFDRRSDSAFCRHGLCNHVLKRTIIILSQCSEVKTHLKRRSHSSCYIKVSELDVKVSLFHKLIDA